MRDRIKISVAAAIRKAFSECPLSEIKELILSFKNQEDKINFAKECAEYLDMELEV